MASKKNYSIDPYDYATCQHNMHKIIGGDYIKQKKRRPLFQMTYSDPKIRNNTKFILPYISNHLIIEPSVQNQIAFQ